MTAGCGTYGSVDNDDLDDRRSKSSSEPNKMGLTSKIQNEGDICTGVIGGGPMGTYYCRGREEAETEEPVPITPADPSTL